MHRNMMSAPVVVLTACQTKSNCELLHQLVQSSDYSQKSKAIEDGAHCQPDRQRGRVSLIHDAKMSLTTSCCNGTLVLTTPSRTLEFIKMTQR
jgi:hypothetical protein